MLQNWNGKPLVGLALLMGLVGCNSPPSATTATPSASQTDASNRPKVVATTSVLCDLTRQVAAQTINLKCLVDAGEDPHIYQPRPEDRKAIDSAQLILYAGYDFDASLIRLVKATTNPAPKIPVHEVSVPTPILARPHSHDHDHDHDHDSNQSQTGSSSEETTPDPHVWHDPQNGIRMVETIADALKQLAPNQATLYQTNTQKIVQELQQLDTWIESQIATIPPAQRQLVTTHDALGYYVKAYNLKFEGALSGLNTEEAPTPARVGELVKEIKTVGVPTLFAETTINPKLIENVAKEAQVKVSDRKLYTDSLGEPETEGDTYQKMLQANTQTIVEGLGGQYIPFQSP